MKKADFDPMAYIENAFLDTRARDAEAGDIAMPRIGNYIDLPTDDAPRRPTTAKHTGAKFKKTQMRAPRPRRALDRPVPPPVDPGLQEVWQSLPKNVEFLVRYFDDSVTANYYEGEFQESRQELIRRLLDPQLSLEETSRLLGVCPATVRRYTNRGWLSHHRTTGGQRRFRLSDIVRFVNEHGRFPEAKTSESK